MRGTAASAPAQRVKALSHWLELIPARSAIDADDRTGNVARHRRGEEHGKRGEILGLAPLTDRNLFLGKMFSIIFRLIATKLLAHDPAGRNAIDGNAVLSDLAGESL